MGNRQVKQTLNIYARKPENPEKRLVFFTPMSCYKEPFNFNLKQENWKFENLKLLTRTKRHIYSIMNINFYLSEFTTSPFHKLFSQDFDQRKVIFFLITKEGWVLRSCENDLMKADPFEFNMRKDQHWQTLTQTEI